MTYGAPLSFEQAAAIARRAATFLTKRSWSAVLAIVDSGGHLVLLHRMDGVQIGSIEAAIDKARTAVLYKRETGAFSAALSATQPMVKFLTVRGLCAIEGGVPVVVEGSIVGAIGVSGMRPEEDAQIAKFAADALLLRPRRHPASRSRTGGRGGS